MNWRTRLAQPGAHLPHGFKSLAIPVYRGSTVVFDRQEDAVDDWRHRQRGYSYGLYGTPTTMELGARIAELENAHYTFIVPGGQAAIALVYLSVCKTGSHVLVPASVYGPNRIMGEDLFKGFGVTVETYDPLIGAGIAALIRPETTLIWCESPCSITMEVQDVPAIVAAAHAGGALVALDNTYAAGVHFDAFRHQVDISIQALTKYIGGHSDLLMGSVSVRDAALYEAVGRAYNHIGMGVSPDESSLALRGLQTLAVRLDRLEQSTLTVARWLAEQPAIQSVLHPALPTCPGHETWKRDFTGSTSVFSVLFKPGHGKDAIARFVDALTLFKIGFSWGGVTSLVIGFPDIPRQRGYASGGLVRLNIGLEEPADLIADLSAALARL